MPKANLSPVVGECDFVIGPTCDEADCKEAKTAEQVSLDVDGPHMEAPPEPEGSASMSWLA